MLPIEQNEFDVISLTKYKLMLLL